ncbi:MAG: AAA family ATPase [Solobacterium sp.]|nr:AAA family ATPase [Solobacterium sp.]
MTKINDIINEMKKTMSGKDTVLTWIVLTALANGHVLLEDIPGVGKTTIAVTLAKVLGLTHGRVQFTPDVLPSDITGFSVYQKESGTLVYQPGVIFCNLFLADELNRATSRTQSALLEAMEEGQVTVDGISRRLPDPFFVLATQNPTGSAGTQLLPDSQIDRFMVRLSIGYPDRRAEIRMAKDRMLSNPMLTVKTVVSPAEFAAMKQQINRIYVHDEVIAYAVDLVEATRKDKNFAQGGSPRATLALIALAKAIAGYEERDYVLPKDIALAYPKVLTHRVHPHRDARLTVEAALDAILKQYRQPKV